MEKAQLEEEAKVKQMIDDLVEKAKIASQEYLKLDQETVNNITKAMSMAGLEHHMELAKMAVQETGRGIYEDKITKNMFATEYIYHSIKYEKTVGVVKENSEDDYMEVAEPIGIIAGVTPVTNPTSTTMFKSIISAKTRNVIIFGFHPSAQKCSEAAATILRDAAIKAGAPDAVQGTIHPVRSHQGRIRIPTGAAQRNGGTGHCHRRYAVPPDGTSRHPRHLR